MIPITQSLGEIAAQHPAAVPILLRHRLDFCCRGGRSLAAACEQLGVDPAAVAGEIAQAEQRGASDGVAWAERPIEELVDHILARFHQPLHDELGGLVEAARKVERVHGDKASCPHGLADHLAAVHDAVEQHLAKEEQVLFPAIRAGMRGAGLGMPIQVMRGEHDVHGEDLRKIRELTSDLTPPPEACATWRGLYASLERFEADLMEHIHLENNVLFPRALD